MKYSSLLRYSNIQTVFHLQVGFLKVHIHNILVYEASHVCIYIYIYILLIV